MENSVSEQATTKAFNFVKGTTFKTEEAFKQKQREDIHKLPTLPLQPIKALFIKSSKPGSAWNGYQLDLLQTGHGVIISSGEALSLGIAVSDPKTGISGIPYSNMAIKKSADNKSIPSFE